MELSSVLVTKRSKKSEPFDAKKIERAIVKCLKQVPHSQWKMAADLDGERLTEQVVRRICSGENCPEGVSVETIQDTVEQVLMSAGYYDQAKAYILFRDKHRTQREQSPVDSASVELIARNNKYFRTPLQEFQFYDKYSKWREELGRRETWEESVDRTLDFLRTQTEKRVGQAVLHESEWSLAREYILNLKALPSMRVIQMAGPALERCNTGAYNCAFIALDSVDAFPELLYLLMQGCGVGFSVESEYVDKIPRVRKQKTEAVDYTIPDSTEGWCEALKVGLGLWFSGGDVRYDYSKIRPQGAKLKTKGGRASGPGPLKELLDFVRVRVLARQGKHLTTLDCHDIACKAGDIVQVGGVRRSAEISLSDLDDEEMRTAKSGQFWLKNGQRAMANNSAVYDEKPSALVFMEEWLSLAQSNTGERGIFNREGILRQIPRRRKRAKFGMNPCGEIVLRSRQFCNLSIVVARANDTTETLHSKTRVAAYLGTVQSLLTDFEYVGSTWKENCEEERLLGVDITGQMDCPILRPGAPGREELLRSLRDTAVEVNKELASRLGISPSAAVTCVKPSGNSSQLLDCSSGLHPRYASYYIRRVRVGAFTPIASLLKECGVPWHPEVGQITETATVLVFDFPVQAPEGAYTRDKIDVIGALESWLTIKTNYTEHNPSCTVYIKDNEWLKAGNWVYEHWDMIGGLSFLPFNGGAYTLAPYEEITEEEYNRLMSTFPNVDYSKLVRFEREDTTSRAGDFACVAGSCEL